MNEEKNIRYSEMFTSFQGEAAYTGVPAVWIRFFGCNLKCPGFGQDNPQDPTTYTNSVDNLSLDNIQDMNMLPVIKRGCDSAYSWHPKFKPLTKKNTAKEIAEKMIQLVRDNLGCVENTFITKLNQPVAIAFTGGEPMLHQKSIMDILSHLKNITGERVPIVMIETNGTVSINFEVMDSIIRYVDHIHFAISPKLYSVSGEKDRVDLKNIGQYYRLADTTVLKFVVNGSGECWDELKKYEEELAKIPCSIWIMPVGATVEDQSSSEVEQIAREGMKRGYYISTRSHAYVFKNKMGT